MTNRQILTHIRQQLDDIKQRIAEGDQDPFDKMNIERYREIWNILKEDPSIDTSTYKIDTYFEHIDALI